MSVWDEMRELLTQPPVDARYVNKEPALGPQVIQELIRHWPRASTSKQGAAMPLTLASHPHGAGKLGPKLRLFPVTCGSYASRHLP